MKVTVDIMVQDPEIAAWKGVDLTEPFTIEGEDFFLDGPVSRRVAVLDFDADSGALEKGVRFVPGDGDEARYELADGDAIEGRDFNCVSVFGTVFKTMTMFEEPDTLGRRLHWAFGAPQLLVVPRAGTWANAFYERDSHSLQFFYVPSARMDGRTVYTSLSHDIVAHETGHAVLDGIAPDLYDAITPQSLALHEAVADLTALAAALRSEPLCRVLLMQTGSSIDRPSALSWIAEELGSAVGSGGRVGYLRSLRNSKSLSPDAPAGDRVERAEPHALSQVLSGALYALLVRLHESYKHKYMAEQGASESAVAFKALWVAARQFTRMVFRALDYLPPGEVSFADYARALLSSDQASHASGEEDRSWLVQEMVRRGIVASPEELAVETNVERAAVRELDLETVMHSDWAAYDFANRNRELLGIPEDTPFQVRPRLDVRKTYFHRDGEAAVRECLFKVSWDHEEENGLGSSYPSRRKVTAGTTLAIDWQRRTLRARLHSDLGERQAADRDLMLERLRSRDALVPARLAVAPDGTPLRSVAVGEAAGGLMRVRGAARLLHVHGSL